MYLNIPEIKNTNERTVFIDKDSSYGFIKYSKGKKESELQAAAVAYYEKEGENEDYYGQITTHLRFTGLLQFDLSENPKDGIVIENELLNSIYESNNSILAKSYMNYYLVNWQNPIPTEKNKDKRRANITKPYLILLKTLLMLKERGSDQAYITEYEFCNIFEDQNIGVNEISEEIIDNIMEGRLSEQGNATKRLGYIKALLRTSDLLTEDTIGFDVKGKFMFGLKSGNNIDLVSKALIKKYKDKHFYVDPLKKGNDPAVITEWGKYINDKQKFIKWLSLYESILDAHDFKVFCIEKGFYYEDSLIRRFISSLETKPFLILTGISGSGKTKISELWIEYKKAKYKDDKIRSLHVSVGSNWNDNKKLLGFKNILLDEESSYIDTELVVTIKNANDEEHRPYIIILDEMNLSHVERYFADFLSALESRSKEIKLPDGTTVVWSKNLKIIGTVNIDETTYMFSPKVLDRANVIEMNGKIPSEYINSIKDSEEKMYKSIKDEIWFDGYVNTLDEIYEAVNHDFGFRLIDEVSQYIKTNTELFGEDSFEEYFDEQICQKILPKLHGAKASLKPKLDALQLIFGGKEAYKLTNSKLEQMQNSVKKGYASFIGE